MDSRLATSVATMSSIPPSRVQWASRVQWDSVSSAPVPWLRYKMSCVSAGIGRVSAVVQQRSTVGNEFEWSWYRGAR